MQEQVPAEKHRGRRLETLAWKFSIGLFGAIQVFLVGFLLMIVIQTPKAASAQWMPAWQWSWDSLGQDATCPTPDGGYCDATLSRRRLCCGPLEIRYSFSY